MAEATVYGSDVVADLLADLGIDYVACNPGATFRGLHDSLVNHRSDVPIIECAHEEIAVAIAHGYAKATGRMMAVALHDVVGLQHAAMAVYNAWCDRVPVLLVGGTGPVDAAKRRPWIDWIHTANPQAEQVRSYTKWDDQPASIHAVGESFVRAHRIAATAPPGPVYVCLDSEVQEQPVPARYRRTVPADYAAPGPIGCDPAAVSAIADRILDAELPAIAVESVDGSADAAADLVAIAELAGVAVVEPFRDYGRPALCMPTSHPLNLTGAWGELPASDLVLAIEVRDLHAVRLPCAPGATIVQAGTAVLGARAWAADLQRLQPTDLTLLTSPSVLLPALRRELESRSIPSSAVRARTNRLTTASTAARDVWRATARAAAPDGRISQANLAVGVWDAVREHRPVLANGSLSDWTHRTWDLHEPSSYLGSSGGAGLGYGLGASIGAALAHRDTGRLVVDLQSDGDLLMTPAGLWTVAHESLPLLIVLDNNRAYQNSVDHAGAIARLRGRDTTRAGVGTTLTDPAVRFTQLAESMGVAGFGPIDHVGQLPEALAAARRVVLEQGRPALVDVITEPSTASPSRPPAAATPMQE